MRIYTNTQRPTMGPTGLAVFCYGCFRFFVEFYRTPDANLGYLAFGWLTMGQVLSTPMIIIGAAMVYRAHTRPA